MQKPPVTFTVGITNYNYSRYLPRAIRSVLDQGAEVIVVDDCSTDDSVEVCEEVFGEYRDARRTLIAHPENSGFVTKGRKEVIKYAAGDYIIHLDADDYLMPGAIQAFSVYSGSDWLVGNLAVVDEQDRMTQTYDYAGWPTTRHEAFELARKQLSLPISMKGAFKTSWLRNHDLGWYEWPNTSFAEDCRTCFEYLLHDPEIVHVPVLTVAYRKHAGQDSANDERRKQFTTDITEYFKGAA